jgi:hypothetical protein
LHQPHRPKIVAGSIWCSQASQVYPWACSFGVKPG